MELSIFIAESDQAIAKAIGNALIPQVKTYMKEVSGKLKKELPTVLGQAIRSTPEYNSLLNGKLRLEFGIPNPEVKLIGLINTWSENVNVVYSNPVVSSNGLIKSSVTVSMIKVDFSDVLFTDYAIVKDGLRGYTLPWLEWLLLEGNRTIVSNYQVVIGPNKRSRTGQAVMKQSKSNWKVPAQFAGTIKDNWITRAIDGAQNDIQSLLDRVIK